MGSLLVRRPDVIYYLVAGYYVLSLVLKLLRPASLEFDDSEQAFLSQYLMLGYGRQPPFYNWLQYAVVGVFGISVASLTVVKNSLLFGCLLFYGLSARLITGDRVLSAIAILGALTLPPIFLLAQRDLTHTVAALFAASLFLFGFFYALKHPSQIGGFLIVGVAAGLGTISKYNFVVLPLAAILALLFEPKFRKRLFDWRVLVSLAAFVTIIAPHGYWVLNNLTQASGGTIAEMKQGAENSVLPHVVLGLYSFAIAGMKGVAVPSAVFAFVFRADLRKILCAKSQWTRIVGRMIIACFFIVAIIVVAIGATHIREKWLALFTVLFPFYLILKVDASGVDPVPRLPALLSIVGVLVIGVILILWASVYIGPRIKDYSLAHTPYGGFARTIREGHGGDPAAIVAEDRVMAGNLRIQFPNTPVILAGFPPNSDVLPVRQGPVLVAWSAEGEKKENIPPRVSRILSHAGVDLTGLQATIISLPYNAGRVGDVYPFAYVWVDLR
ncbi:glycosyltransferase family 39 protein [Ensifer sp. MPMI2T]|nr:glycosyltransferase family 39 protein [Ensifer sp. MPMI2T]